jgi:hypothetical protein
MRYLTDDLLPVFLGAGRGSLSLAREIYRVYGARSVILSEEDCPRRILPFATLRPVSPRLWSEAVWDLVKKEPVGRSALLFAGNLFGAEQKENGVRFFVRDTGIGMDAETRRLAFDRFHQAERGRSDKGSGLGLSIAHEILQKMGVDIQVESRKGEGSEFSFIIPLGAISSPALPE